MASSVDNWERISHERLREFAHACLASVGVSSADAAVVGDVLVAADLRGVTSHGMARLRRYVDGVRHGKIAARVEYGVLRRQGAVASLDARNGLGQPASVAAMRMAIDIAGVHGIGAVTVRNSNHFGIAGYYSMLAVEEQMVGLVTSNASAQVAPTGSFTPTYGTNPLSVAVPSAGECAFVLDMATSVVPRGRLEMLDWAGEGLPPGWSTSANGAEPDGLTTLISGLRHRDGHAILPLGGRGQVHGGHKGYGLGLMVDLFACALAGAAGGQKVYGPGGANLGQFFLAIDVSALRPLEHFLKDVEGLLAGVTTLAGDTASSRVWYAGQKEHEQELVRKQHGVPLPPPVVSDLKRLAVECGALL